MIDSPRINHEVEVQWMANFEFLLRVKSNIKARVLEVFADGSALVEIRLGTKKFHVREIRGSVRKSGKGSLVRVWSSLLDWRKHPARELLALYGRRWEEEGFYKELKVDMRSAELLKSHTLDMAAQEVAALILGYAIIGGRTNEGGQRGELDVLRISFMKTLVHIRGLWQFLEVFQGIITAAQSYKLIRRTLKLIAKWAIPKRRQRSCPRALRQPVSSWPRLLKNTYKNGAAEYHILPATA